MERSIKKIGLVNLLALLALGIAAYIVGRYAHSPAGQISAVFIGIGMLVGAVSWFQMRLEENERIEKLEYDELIKNKSASALFENRDAESFPAQRSREQFERFFVPVFAVILFVVQGGGAFFLWRWLSTGLAGARVEQPVVAIALFALFFLLLFMLGRFSAAFARIEDHRLLRPGASWLLLSAYLCLIVALGMVGVWGGFPQTDFIIARVFCGLLGLLALETLVALVLEIYRPRVPGKAQRPIYESRLVGLLGQPEGLITTAAQALDYQFGFKVSETWFFQLLQRHLPTLLGAQIAVLFLSTAFVVINPGEQGILERFGKPVPGRSVLHPGFHLKLPWPIDKVYRFDTRRIQVFDVGFHQTAESEQMQTIVWTVPHTKEENFLVASHEAATVESSGQTNSVRVPPVSLLSVSIPVQFQITNVLDWAYNNADATNLLADLAYREVGRYLVSVDVNAMMSTNRLAAGDELRRRIQQAAAAYHLGVRILYAGITGIHPPVKVAPDYEKVVAESQIKESTILDARTDAFHTNTLADAQSFSTTNEAMAARQQLEVSSLARAALFTNQIPAFDAAPSVYRQRVYFQTFSRAVADAQKYILLTTNTRDVLVFDLENKIRADLLNSLSVTPPKK